MIGGVIREYFKGYAFFYFHKRKEAMNYQAIIDKYYNENDELHHVLLTHSRSVADKALQIARRHPELHADEHFLEEAAMLHDIGIIRCHAPGIHCFGTESYICHGRIGAELLREEGYPRHARVCERHTGAGLSADDISRQQLPLPAYDFLPESVEEQIICYADKFFSKTHLDEEKTFEQARKSLMKFGEPGLNRFEKWAERFE